MRSLRGLTGAAATLAVLACAPAASADFTNSARLGTNGLGSAAGLEPAPLEGKGENMELVANVPIDPGTQGVAASDLELHGNHAFVGSYGEGVVVVDVSDPLNPRRVGKFDCPGGQNDIQLSPDGHYLALAIETTANKCHPNDEGTAILDISDPTSPREIAWIGEPELPDGSHNNTLDWPYLYVDQYIHTYSMLEIFDLSNPSQPRKTGEIRYGGQDSHHDLIVDHRPDGRNLAYAASINFSDVLDVTDPSKPVLLERIKDPQLTISHQAEPNFDRTLALVTDEYGGGLQTQACGGSQRAQVAPPGTLPPQVEDPASLGALHLYRLEQDGTFGGANGIQKAGIFNIPYQTNDDPDPGCTIHVFWQAPDENRLVTAWYGRGTRVVDFSNPARPTQLGWFIPEGADTWSAKPHNGYIYAGDIRRGLDVLRYTGEGGARWPATSGPAEAQRARQQGASPDRGIIGEPLPQQGGSRRQLGRRTVTKHVRVPKRRRKKATLVVSFYKGRQLVQRQRVRARTGRVKALRITAAGLAGRYGYRVRLGDRGRVLRNGSFRVKRDDTTQVALREGETLVCQIR